MKHDPVASTAPLPTILGSSETSTSSPDSLESSEAHRTVMSGRYFTTLRRFALGAFILLCVIAALQSHPTASTIASEPGRARQMALAQASSLLLEPSPQNVTPVPRAFYGDVTRTTSARVQQVSEDRSPPAIATAIALPAHAVPIPAPVDTHGPVAGLARAPILAQDVTAASPPPTRVDSSTPSTSSHPVAPTSPPMHAVRRTIPKAIEGTDMAQPPGDALSGVDILALQRVQEGSTSPFVLMAIRTDDGPLRAQIRKRGAAQSEHATVGWLEAGDSPAPGWHVLAIARGDVLLLSPQGSTLRLRLTQESPGAPTAAPTVTHPVISTPARP